MKQKSTNENQSSENIKRVENITDSQVTQKTIKQENDQSKNGNDKKENENIQSKKGIDIKSTNQQTKNEKRKNPGLYKPKEEEKPEDFLAAAKARLAANKAKKEAEAAKLNVGFIEHVWLVVR